MLIDFHTHVFPDKLYERAINSLLSAIGDVDTYSDGSLNGLKNSMKENRVDISVVLNIATNEKQQKNVNDFAKEINNEKDIFSFGSVYPDSKDAFYYLEMIKDMGLKGIKLHSEYQNFKIDDEKYKPLYKKISSLGLITVFHAGFDYGYPPPYKAMPKNMAKAASWFDTPIVCAHWGGLNTAPDTLKYLCGMGENIYIDTSFGFGGLPKAYAEMIIDKLGVDKVLFGTDNPWHSSNLEMRFLNSLSLSKSDMDKITHQNAMKLLGI